MWKKLLSIAIALGLLSANASALAVPVQPAAPAEPYFNNVQTTPSTFDPKKGESSLLSFDLLKDATIDCYITDSASKIVADLALMVPYAAGNNRIFAWYGTVNNAKINGEALPEGDYLVHLTAYIKNANNNYIQVDAVQKFIKIAYVVDPNTPVVTNLKTDPLKFSAQEEEDTEISFDVSKDAYLTVEIKEAAKGGPVLVKSFGDYTYDWYKSTEDHSINWDGTDNSGKVVLPGVYTVFVTAKNDSGEVTAKTTVDVVAASTSSSGVIKDVTLDPKSTWDPTDEELNIDFELTSEVKSLTVEAKQGNEVIEILDEDYADDDDYSESWDGTDDDGDYVDGGVWEITVRADGDKVTKTITLEYEKANISSALVTKSSFDPSEEEFTTLLLKLDASAVVTVEVFKGSKKEMTLWDEEEVSKNRWYAVEFDGIDEDGDEVDYGKDWKFKIIAENATDDDIVSTDVVEFDVEEDEVSDKKANVTNDYIVPVVSDDEDSDFAGYASFSYCLDEDADAYLAVYKGSSTSGDSEIELLDYVAQDAGCHSVDWDLTNDKGKELKDGVYSYKLISKANGNYKDTESGVFVVGDSGNNVKKPEPPKPEPPTPPETESCVDYYSDLYNLTLDSETCQAIVWATESGIFSGYPDGTFKLNNYINRAETLKVILEAFDAYLYPTDGSTQGFNDVEPWGWYMSYVKSAKIYGMLAGYNNGKEARLNNYVTRAELLKFALEASHMFAGLQLFGQTGSYSYYGDVSVNDWYFKYTQVAYSYILFQERFENGVYYIDPNKPATREDVVLLLSRMNNNGLLTGYMDAIPYAL